METKISEDLGLNKGVNDGVPLSTLATPGEEWCRKIVNLVVAMVKFETATKAS